MSETDMTHMVFSETELITEANNLATALNQLKLQPSPQSVLGMLYLAAGCALDMDIPKHILISLLEMVMANQNPEVANHGFVERLDKESVAQLKSTMHLRPVTSSITH